MAKILLAHHERMLGNDLEFFFKEEGHSIDWYQTPGQMKKLYDDIPSYDVAVVDRSIWGVSSDEMIQRLKERFPDKKVLCLTHDKDHCKYADRNFGIITEGVLKELLREVNVKPLEGN